jgi:hypothetical protein
LWEVETVVESSAIAIESFFFQEGEVMVAKA